MTKKQIALMCIVGIVFYCVLPIKKTVKYPFTQIKSYKNFAIHCDKHTLVTFDVDNTIIMAQNPASLSYGGNVPWWFQLYAVIRYPSLLWNYEYVTSLLFAESPRVLVEPEIVSVISACRKRCTVVGLTSMESGHWGIIESMPEWRYRMLAAMGVHFSSLPNQTFDRLPHRRGTHPMLYNGIICTNQQPKGKALGAFIDSMKERPHLIVSFDDQISALQSIALACKERAIPFMGYQYRGALDKKAFDYVQANEELSGLMQRN